MSNDCGGLAACVGGRCQSGKPGAKATVDSARRVVARPVAIAYASRDTADDLAAPAVVAIGKNGGALLLRFAASIPPGARIVEAYVVLARSSLVDDDPLPLVIHAARVVEPWTSGTIAWPLLPRSTNAKTASTTVLPYGVPRVRVDVGEIARRWPFQDPSDRGIAIVAEDDTASGLSIGLAASGTYASAADATGHAGSPGPTGVDVEPYLELYLR